MVNMKAVVITCYKRCFYSSDNIDYGDDDEEGDNINNEEEDQYKRIAVTYSKKTL